VFIGLTTVANEEAGLKLADSIVRERLAACVQILPRMTSVYLWKGEIQKEAEHLLLIKTDAEKWPQLEAFLANNHPYDVPEIVAIESENVSEPYRAWLEAALTDDAAL
jgi:periplasmic divalent cation tolerance protein